MTSKQQMSRSYQSGFTLIEIIGVLAVIAILGGIIAPKVFDAIGDARYRQAEGNIHAIQTAMVSFAKDTGVWPGRQEGVYYLYGAGTGSTPASAEGMCGGSGTSANLADYLINNIKNYSGWRGPYIDGLPEDPWGFRYAVNVGGLFGLGGGNVWILSPGPDGVCDTLRTAEEGANDDVALMIRRLGGSGTVVTAASVQITTTPTQQAPTVKKDLTTLQGADILTLTAAEIATLTPEQIAMMPATDYGKFSTAQKAALTQSQLKERVIADTVRAIANPRPWTMQAADIKYLMASQLDTVPRAVFGSNLNTQQLQAISPATIKQMSGEALAGIASATKLSPEQIASIPTSVSKNMRVWTFNVAQIKALSAGQLSTISQTIVQSNLNPQQLQAITPATIQQMSGGALVGMAVASAKLTPEQISVIPTSVSKSMKVWGFNTAQMQALSAAQLNTIPQTVVQNNLQPQQLQAITPATIQQMSGGALVGMSVVSHKLTPAQISVIPTSVSKSMKLWGFNTAQMQVLSAAQLSTIPQNVMQWNTSAQNLQAIPVNVIKAVQGPALVGLKAASAKLTAAQRTALGI